MTNESHDDIPEARADSIQGISIRPADSSDTLSFLMHRYDQLLKENMTTNEMIHNTFYISIVVFGALIGVVPQLASVLPRATVYLFAAGIFLAMFLWTRTYLNSRQEVETQMQQIVKSVEQLDDPINGNRPVEEYFSKPDDFRQDRWEQDWIKERILMLYYLALSSFSMLIFGLDMAITVFGVEFISLF